MKAMTASSHKILRFFVLLLLTVFISETVYASSMMAVAQVVSTQAEMRAAHCDENHQSPSHFHHQEKQQSHANCHDCSHCFACVSMIVQDQFHLLAQHSAMIGHLAFAEIYHSPSSIQPQKPPIS